MQPSDGPETRESDGHAVGVLLAVAAVLGALLAGRAAFLSSDAGHQLQTAIREDLKRGTMAVGQVGYVYGTEAVQAFGVATALVRAEEARKVAASSSPDAAAMLEFEAQIQDGVVESVRAASAVASDPKYALPDGSYDMQLRMLDERATEPEVVALEPDATMAAADALGERAGLMMSTTIAIALAFLFGALAQAIQRRRSRLVALGWGAITVGVMLALALEFLV